MSDEIHGLAGARSFRGGKHDAAFVISDGLHDVAHSKTVNPIVPDVVADSASFFGSKNGRLGKRVGGMRRASHKRGHGTRRSSHRIRNVVLALCLFLLCYTAYMCVSTLIIKREAAEALAVANDIPRQLQDSFTDVSAKEELKSSLDTLSEHVASIQDQTESPGWAVLEWLPYYGHDVKSVRDTVRILDDIGDNALPQLRNALSCMDYTEFGISDGVVRLPGLGDASVYLDMADSAMTDANTELQLVEETHIGRLDEALSSIKTQVNSLTEGVDLVTRFAQTAPSMLDLNGEQPQTYLVLAENNSELRATGGLPGAWGTLTVAGGVLSLSDFVPDTSVSIQDESVISLTSEEMNLYGDEMGRIPHDVNITPDFPRAAQAAKALWETSYPERAVDGVIALDPVFLQDLLQVTGNVTLSDGRILDGSNTVQTLLHDVYFESDDTDWQNEFFAETARSVFDKITHTSKLDLMQMIRQTAASVENGHFKIWHESSSIQNELEGATISGTLSASESLPAVGVYFNDAGQSKMDWYLNRNVTATLQSEQADGSRLYDVDIELSNMLSEQDVSSLPAYVLGDGVDGLQSGELAVNMYLYAPYRGRLVEWTFQDDSDFDLLTTHDGLTVGAKRIVLQPGQSLSIHVTVQTAAAPVQSALQVRQTPLLKE